MRGSTGPRRFLDVADLASRGAVLTGRVDPGSMPRLLELVTGRPGAITYRVEFTRDAAGRPGMSGRIEGRLPLTCQRCLDPFDWRFDTAFDTLVVGDEGEETDGRDAVVCPGGRVALEPVIEDEMLLALPHAPVHPRGACQAPRPRSAGAGGEDPGGRPGPFSALQTLRSRDGRGRSR